MIIPEKRLCDLCKEENPRFVDVKVPMVVCTERGDITDKYGNHRWAFKNIDLCERCAVFATNLVCEYDAKTLQNPKVRRK